MINDPTTITLIHPHPVEREGMANYLGLLQGFRILKKVASPEGLLKNGFPEETGIVLAFFTELPEKADWITTLRKHTGNAFFMVSTATVHIERLRDYLRVGLMGYVCTDVDTEEFERALRIVAQGKQYYSQKVMVALAEASGARAGNEPEAIRKSLLSNREMEILRLVANEYSSVMIASELCISEKTVETHRRNLFQKLGVKNSIGLTKAAVRLGLV